MSVGNYRYAMSVFPSDMLLQLIMQHVLPPILVDLRFVCGIPNRIATEDFFCQNGQNMQQSKADGTRYPAAYITCTVAHRKVLATHWARYERKSFLSSPAQFSEEIFYRCGCG